MLFQLLLGKVCVWGGWVGDQRRGRGERREGVKSEERALPAAVQVAVALVAGPTPKTLALSPKP